MKTLLLSAVAAIGLCLTTAAPAKAQYWTQQYYYTPNTAYQYNSSGATNTVERTGTGLYTVTFPGLGNRGVVENVNGGIVHVTAAQRTTSRRCQVDKWRSFTGFTVAGDVEVDIACHTESGVPADSRFAVQFTK